MPVSENLHDQLASLLSGYWYTQTIYVAAKLLIVEGVVPPGNEPSVNKFFDLAMMALPGGMERTEVEYRQLFEAAGFQLTRIVPTRTWVSVIEGEAWQR